jgi:tetratricopeptide (TPR) repeat protein
MNPIASLVVTAAVATAAAVVFTSAIASSAAPATTPAAAELQRTLDELRAGQQQLQQQVRQLEAARLAAAPAQAALERTSAPLSGEQVAAAVEAYLAQRAGAKAAGAATEAAAAPATGFDLEADFATLAAGNYWQNPDAWKRAFASGRMDEVLKKFEALAKAQPQDAKAQMQYANALFASQQLDPSKWQNSVRADQVLDKVLALDDRHWEARFSKALSYTFYPPFLGKQKDAITHFQKLVDQQDQSSPQPHEAQTYLYLGNLLQERDPAQARAIWQKGAARHPESQELAGKLAGR